MYKRQSKNLALRISALILLIAGIVAVYPTVSQHLSIAALAEREAEIRAGQAARPLFYAVIAFFAYVIATALSMPGTSALSLIMGWMFGVWLGIPLVSFASTLGAYISFIAARYFLRGMIERRLAGPLKAFEDRFGDDCPSCLFSMRMMPGIPNIMTNTLPAFTEMRGFTFWWVSQLGMLPGTIAFVYVGANLPNIHIIAEKGVGSLISPGLIIGFAALGLLPVLIRMIMGRFGKGKPSQTSNNT